MARKRSIKSLASQKPYWYCVTKPIGNLRGLAAQSTSRKLFYVTDPREVKAVWQYLGNPKFRGDYDYLLLNYTPDGVYNEIFAVRLPEESDSPRGEFNAFEGEVDQIMYGWTTRAHAMAMRERGYTGKPESERRGLKSLVEDEL